MKNLFRALFLAILLSSCASTVQTDKTAIINRVTEVKVVKSELTRHARKLNFTGTVYADKEANLGSALPGRVEKEYFAEGSRVNKGDLLVSMSGEMLAQASLENSTLEKDYQRVSRLIEKGSITQQEFDHIKSLYEASCSRLEMIRRNSEITALFSGTVVEYLVKEGENYLFNFNFDPGYSRTSGIVRLMKLDPVVVETEVNEKELSGIKTGYRAEITFDALPDTILYGRVTSISPMLSSITHTSLVKISIANPVGMLKPGMYAKASIILPEINSVSIPLNAINRQPGTGDDYVYVVRDGKARKVKIKTVWTEGATAGIRDLEPGETVVTAGREKLTDGSDIKITL
ncbi:MAG: efflux RND transporter periplasmic adaptor subunit [Bacteroidales bacterium]